MDDRNPVALEDRSPDGDRLFSPSAARNKSVVRDVLKKYLPVTGKVLEVGSGTGEHAALFAEAMPRIGWAPGDPDARSRMSISAWARHVDLQNIDAPHAINVADADWGIEDESLTGIVSLNMIHISPFSATKGLFSGAAKYLVNGGILFLYGPFSRNGEFDAPSNAAFDTNLRSRNPTWGVRDLDHDLLPLAQLNALALSRIVAMPANNLSVIFKKQDRNS